MPVLYPQISPLFWELQIRREMIKHQNLLCSLIEDKAGLSLPVSGRSPWSQDSLQALPVPCRGYRLPLQPLSSFDISREIFPDNPPVQHTESFPRLSVPSP